MQNVADYLKTWQPHPFVDHFTVALVLVAVFIDLIASLASSRLWIRYTALILIILAAIATFGSNLTGGWEADRVWSHVSGPAKAVLERHAYLGDILPWVIGALALWRLGIQFMGFIAGLRPLYLLIAIVASVFIIYQGYLGGKLVYDYQVGTGREAADAVTASPLATESATPAPEQPTPIPTVYVPSPESTPAVAPPAAEPAPSVANSPASVQTPVGGSLSSSPSVPSTPASATPAPSNPPTSTPGTPVSPPPGPTAPAGSPAPKPTTL